MSALQIELSSTSLGSLPSAMTMFSLPTSVRPGHFSSACSRVPSKSLTQPYEFFQKLWIFLRLRPVSLTVQEMDTVQVWVFYMLCLLYPLHTGLDGLENPSADTLLQHAT